MASPTMCCSLFSQYCRKGKKKEEGEEEGGKEGEGRREGGRGGRGLNNRDTYFIYREGMKRSNC
jgi:hypothetical protein